MIWSFAPCVRVTVVQIVKIIKHRLYSPRSSYESTSGRRDEFGQDIVKLFKYSVSPGFDEV